MKTDLEAILKNAVLIPVSEVPTRRGREIVDWRKIFSEIPKGKAWEVRNSEISHSTVIAAVNRYQERGFPHLRYHRRTDPETGERISYVLYPREKK